MEFKYVFKKGQGIQANEDNSRYYIVQKDVVTNDENEKVPVLVQTEQYGSSNSEERAGTLAELIERYSDWMAD